MAEGGVCCGENHTLVFSSRRKYTLRKTQNFLHPYRTINFTYNFIGTKLCVLCSLRDRSLLTALFTQKGRRRGLLWRKPQHRKCDKPGCENDSPVWRVFGCGHSFHVECIIPNISTCQICEKTLLKRLEELTEKARQAVFDIDDGSKSNEGDEPDDGVEGEEVKGASGRVAVDDEVNLASEIEDFDIDECPKIEELLTEIWSWQRHDVQMQ